MADIEAAALAWYRAKERQRETLDALRAYRKEHGGCTEADTLTDDGEPQGPCWSRTRLWHVFPFDQWCAVCRGSQPLYEARTKAAHVVGDALKALNRACKRSGDMFARASGTR